MSTINNINQPIGLEEMKFCFHIKLQSKEDLYLTEYDKAVIINDKSFLPNSGVTLVRGEFNDSATNHIILKGIFEKNGIEDWHDLTESIITIYIYYKNKAVSYITYICSIYTKRDLDFTIYLEPVTTAYNKPLLKLFSKNCRANFGDSKCGVNKVDYSKKYQVSKIIGCNLIIANLDKLDGYYKHGEVIFDNGFCSRIINSLQNIIIIEKTVPEHLQNNKFVTVIAGCDKNFISCCNKFNNAVNFRGEPFVPTDDFIKLSVP